MPALSPHTQSNNSDVYGLPMPGNPYDLYGPAQFAEAHSPHGHPPQLTPNSQPLAQTVKSSSTPLLHSPPTPLSRTKLTPTSPKE
ncbi:hypothetical protein E4T56_gene1267 [Termitomyces sp. T112]|nr:hypothetical protein E4T56_gene1267 [Termitomyces sp. T112]